VALREHRTAPRHDHDQRAAGHADDLAVAGDREGMYMGLDFPAGEFAPGIIALVGSRGSVRQVADGIAFPNGVVVLATARP
jgi:hypothetical protein